MTVLNWKASSLRAWLHEFDSRRQEVGVVSGDKAHGTKLKVSPPLYLLPSVCLHLPPIGTYTKPSVYVCAGPQVSVSLGVDHPCSAQKPASAIPTTQLTERLGSNIHVELDARALEPHLRRPLVILLLCSVLNFEPARERR